MKVTATVRNAPGAHETSVRTDAAERTLSLPGKAQGGCAVNGGELLMLAIATCYCNDLYREAAKLGIRIDRMEVEASAQFADVGLAARDIAYRAKIESPDGPGAVAGLLRHTDAVAEVHNTIRAGVPVTLED